MKLYDLMDVLMGACSTLIVIHDSIDLSDNPVGEFVGGFIPQKYLDREVSGFTPAEGDIHVYLTPEHLTSN